MKVMEELKLGDVMESDCTVGGGEGGLLCLGQQGRHHELMAYDLRPRGYKRASHMESYGKGFPGNRNSKCQGPEVRVCLVCWEAEGRPVGLEGIGKWEE